MNASNLKYYLEDPLLDSAYAAIKEAGPIRSVSLDITNECNLRCKGCYYFGEGMDNYATAQDTHLNDWINHETERGTNFVTIVGGEPSLALPRLKRIYDHFKINVATNGIEKIPVEGFENLPIGVAIWGNASTDSHLRANGRRNLFNESLRNYKYDERAFWYYTVAPGFSHEVEEVVDRCVQNGNRVLFNYYSDLSGLGGGFDFRHGFSQVQDVIDRMTEKYPGKILSTPYFNKVISTGKLFEMNWGFEVCTNLSENFSANEERLRSGAPSNKHFRAYNADFSTTRRCCTGTTRNCDSCFDTWEHFSWVMLYFRRHLHSKQEFTNWLSTMYLFYAINRIIENGVNEDLLIQLQQRTKESLKQNFLLRQERTSAVHQINS